MFCDEWIKVDALLQQKLKGLQTLEQEGDMLVAKVKQQGEITPELKQEMNVSLGKYEKLANEIANLKKTAKALKAKKTQA